METAERPWWYIALVGRNPQRTLLRALLLAATCFLVYKFAFVPIRVEGVSMLPAYKTRDISVVSRLAYKFGPPQRGDVVAIRMAGEHLMLLKRIVGLPGETISFRNGQLLINGQPIQEPYVKLPCNWNIPPEKIATNMYYVVGDNRSMEHWDHTKGQAAFERIVGKAIR